MSQQAIPSTASLISPLKILLKRGLTSMIGSFDGVRDLIRDPMSGPFDEQPAKVDLRYPTRNETVKKRKGDYKASLPPS